MTFRKVSLKRKVMPFLFPSSLLLVGGGIWQLETEQSAQFRRQKPHAKEAVQETMNCSTTFSWTISGLSVWERNKLLVWLSHCFGGIPSLITLIPNCHCNLFFLPPPFLFSLLTSKVETLIIETQRIKIVKAKGNVSCKWTLAGLTNQAVWRQEDFTYFCSCTSVFNPCPSYN